ncbi:MAG: hypothetical protein BGO51_06520 [Rhodospirillales bacterium 69-11]|nr:DUF4167 domain-containing protein [Rhodospirillales bacterium]MBN8928633.1 DUF4167 domain-containing protein [Rhodospirillales bacterium]OJW26693.1 MAG: hypothetical protein BGO51_06520 [Rhodospirillales bacterium 69-11]
MSRRDRDRKYPAAENCPFHPSGHHGQVMTSNGPDVRVRGFSCQIVKRYEDLAKESRFAGHTMLAEQYTQHADHYTRVATGAA